jgi:hypothetical protein
MLRKACAFDCGPDFADVYFSTFAIIFLGTPFWGSKYASWALIADRIARAVGFDTNNRNLKALNLQSDVLEILREDFRTLKKQDTFKVRIFQEAKGLSDLKPFDAKYAGLTNFKSFNSYS